MQVNVCVQALDLFRSKNYYVGLMDSALDGQFSDEDRTELMHLASRCLKTDPNERPGMKFLTSTLSRLERRAELRPISVKKLMPVSVSLSPYYSRLIKY